MTKLPYPQILLAKENLHQRGIIISGNSYKENGPTHRKLTIITEVMIEKQAVKTDRPLRKGEKSRFISVCFPGTPATQGAAC